MDKKIERLAELLLSSKSTVALTGAGISTESGIPDFRSNKSGIYSKFSPQIFSGSLFERDPAHFYAFARQWLHEIASSQPNKAHSALAWLEQEKLLDCTITQNIDGLHYTAGSKNVIEIHGDLRTGNCLSCHTQATLEEIKNQLYINKIDVPCCKECGGVLKPNVVFFGDSLPASLSQAIDAAKEADLFLVLGSSLRVNPAAALPSLCEGNIVIINYTETHLDSQASLIIREGLGETMEMVKNAVSLYNVATR